MGLVSGHLSVCPIVNQSINNQLLRIKRRKCAVSEFSPTAVDTATETRMTSSSPVCERDKTPYFIANSFYAYSCCAVNQLAVAGG